MSATCLKRPSVKSQYGFLLVTAIFLLVILAALGAFILTISGTQQTSSALDVQGARAYQAARAGIEWASDQLLITAGGCAGYLYQRTVTIDRTKVPNTDQGNFPMLFSGTYSGSGASLDLRTVANGGKVTNASGFDIIFTSDSAGATKLDHEIESYNAATGAVNFWVRVPTVSTTTDTVIYLCYGNSAITTSQENKSGVWDTNFKGVWHLKETSGQHQDSTSNAHTSSAISVSAQGSAAGRANGADNFGANNQRITFPDSADWDLPGTFTLEAWVNGANENTADQTVIVRNNAGNTDWDYALLANRGVTTRPACYYTPPAGVNSDGPDVNPNAWTHIVCLWDGTSLKIYIDGVFHGSAIGNPPAIDNSSNSLFIGGDATFNQGYVGIIDEVRISTTARSADWIKAQFNNQSSPSTFYTLGAENAGSNFATLCNPGPTTQNVTGMGGTLSGFTAAVQCSSTTHTEGGATVTVYQITSTGEKGTVGTLDRVERQLQVTLNK